MKDKRIGNVSINTFENSVEVDFRFQSREEVIDFARRLLSGWDLAGALTSTADDAPPAKASAASVKASAAPPSKAGKAPPKAADEDEDDSDEDDSDEDDEDDSDEDDSDEDDSDDEDSPPAKPTKAAAAEAAPDDNKARIGVAELKVLREKKKLREVLEYLIHEKGLRSRDKLIKACLKLQDKVPALQRIEDLEERVPGAIDLLDPTIK